jgi:hypothetical protein
MFGKNAVKYALSIAAAVAVAASADTTSASQTGLEKITGLTVHHQGPNHVIVRMTNVIPQAQRPACHHSWFDRHYVFDVATNKGRAMLSLLTSAYLAGKSAVVFGGLTCTTVGGDVIETATSVDLR